MAIGAIINRLTFPVYGTGAKVLGKVFTDVGLAILDCDLCPWLQPI